MGRGQRQSQPVTASSARDLLYGRRQRGFGPGVLSPDCDGGQFSQLVAFHLASEGYIKGIRSDKSPGKNDKRFAANGSGRTFFDIFDESGSFTTRLEAKSNGDGNGLALQRAQTVIRSVDPNDNRFNFHPGQKNVADLDAMEIDLLIKGGQIGLDYVERILDFAELKERLNNGQALELVANDQDNSAEAIHDYLTNMAERVAGNDQEANNLVYRLGFVPSDQPEKYLKAMLGDPLGKKILAGRSTWRVRRYRRK